jgi:two-component system phosphate regulon sensor histidine kinase PhoR
MSFIEFVGGLSLGIGFCLWKQYRVNQQFKRLFYLLSDDFADTPSLSLLSLVRREVSRIREKIELLNEDINTCQYLLEIAPVGYLVVDYHNQLLCCNQQAQGLLEIEQERWQPGQVRLFLEVVRCYELDELIENTRNLASPQVLDLEFYPHKNVSVNVTSPLYLKAFSFPLNQGNIAVFLENQQSLSELQKYRDRSFSDLTHELKTPLTAISLVAETLERRLQNPERGWVQQMLQEIRRLIDLVNNWLEITQLKENPSLYLEYQSLELRELIFSVWQNLKLLADRKEIALNYLGPEIINLEGDRPRLTQVFVNILDNAIKHSPPGGIIKLEIKENLNTDTVEINIIDSGSGFVEADLSMVFKRLYKADPSRTRQSRERLNQGNGLGLAIAEEIIIAHQGKIYAKNHPQTGGAWLQIILPLNKFVLKLKP